MGLGISAPVVYEEPTVTKYRASGVGSVLLEVVGVLAVIIVPIVIALAMGDFWIQHNQFTARPSLNYTGKAMLKMSTDDGSTYLWSSSDNVMRSLEGDPRAALPYVSLLQDDRDRDGKPDAVTFNIYVPLNSGDVGRVTSFEFLPAFNYAVDSAQLSLKFESAPLISASIPVQQSSSSDSLQLLRLDGDLRLSVLQPLESSWWVRYDHVYTRSLFEDVRDASDVLEIGKFAGLYALRNESLVFERRVVNPDSQSATSTVITGSLTGSLSDGYDHVGDVTLTALLGTAPPNEFRATVHMRVVPASIDYVPSLAEVLKQAWIQFFCIAFVIQWLYNVLVRRVLVKFALVNTIAIFETN